MREEGVVKMGEDMHCGDGRPDPGQDGCVAIVGAGYVGLALAAYLVQRGRLVFLVEVDPERRRALAKGELPIHEEGVDSVLIPALRDGVVAVTGELERALEAARVVFVTVGTPTGGDGHPDLGAVTTVIGELRAHAKPGTVVVLKSTVPPGTGRLFQDRVHSGVGCDLRI
jgi:UDPglucose 6-dehydrogenase